MSPESRQSLNDALPLVAAKFRRREGWGVCWSTIPSPLPYLDRDAEASPGPQALYALAVESALKGYL